MQYVFADACYAYQKIGCDIWHCFLNAGIKEKCQMFMQIILLASPIYIAKVHQDELYTLRNNNN